MIGRLGRLFGGLKRTRETLVSGMRRLLGKGTLNEALLDDMEELLYTSDLGPVPHQWGSIR